MLLRAEDRSKAKAKPLRDPFLPRATIGAVNPDETQLLAETAASSEKLQCPIAVRQVSSADQDGQHGSHYVDEKMPFPSCDAFAVIIASHTCRSVAGLGCLTIDTASRWMLVTPEEKNINHQAHIQAAGSSPRFGRGNQMLNLKPLAVSQICRVSFCFHKDYVYHNLADNLYFSNSLLGKEPN